jgi:hypothetical protein
MLSASCRDDALPRSPRLDEILQQFAVRRDDPPKPSEKPPEIRVFLDRSESMRGFAAAGGSRYQQVLGAILNHAVTSGGVLQIFGFAAGIERLGVQTDPSEPRFYNGAETDFRDLFSYAAPRPGSVSIIISDFVQSVEGGDQRELIASLSRNQGGENRQIQLLAFRSAFQGLYFVETRGSGARKFHVDLDGSSPLNSRPFYLLVIADSKNALEDARRYLFSDIRADQELKPCEAAFEVVDVHLASETRPTGTEENRWSHSLQLEQKLWEVASGGGRINSFIALGDDYRPLPSLRVEIGARARTPLRSITDLQIQSEARTRDRTGWHPRTAVMPQVDWAPDGKGHPAVKETPIAPNSDWGFVLNLPLPWPPRDTWDVYRVRIEPGKGNLLPPLWVESYTTYDDSQPDNANRTLRFKIFVEALIRSIQEHVTVLDQYVLVRRAN